MYRILGFLSLGVLTSLFLVYPRLDGDMLGEHNLLRSNRGINSLVISTELNERAANHAKKMARSRRLFHSVLTPKPGESEGENVAAGTNMTVTAAIKAWWKSAGHRRNMLGDYTEMGYGRAENGGVTYWCVIFRKR